MQARAIDLQFVDIPSPEQQKNPIRFTFLWLEENRWEGKDYTVKVFEQDTTNHSSANSVRKSKYVTTVG